MDELVSIIVPVYNAEKYIMNCVTALKRQLYHNIEIILVDDGSTDESPRMCDMLHESDERIKVVHKKNGGVSTARNAGIEIATGYYLMFADSDDLVDVRWVSRMIELAQQWNVNFVISNYRMVDHYNEAKAPIDHEKAFDPVWAMTREEFFNTLGYMITFRDVMFAPWNKLFVTKVVKENHIKFPEDMHYGEDFLFNLQYIEFCNGVIETREQLYNYILQNPDSLEAKYKTDLYENQTRLYRAAKELMINHNAYCGFNITNLAYYYVNRTIAAIKNQYNDENEKTELETRKYVESIFENTDIVESAFLMDLHENREQSVFSDLVKTKQYDKIYDALRDVQKFERENKSTVRYKVIPQTAHGLRWIPFAFKSVKKYGFVITAKRIVGKVIRKMGRK